MGQGSTANCPVPPSFHKSVGLMMAAVSAETETKHMATEENVPENKFIVFYTTEGRIDWLGEWDTLEQAQQGLDDRMANHTDIESGWIVQTVGRNYSNT